MEATRADVAEYRGFSPFPPFQAAADTVSQHFCMFNVFVSLLDSSPPTHFLLPKGAWIAPTSSVS